MPRIALPYLQNSLCDPEIIRIIALAGRPTFVNFHLRSDRPLACQRHLGAGIPGYSDHANALAYHDSAIMIDTGG